MKWIASCLLILSAALGLYPTGAHSDVTSQLAQAADKSKKPTQPKRHILRVGPTRALKRPSQAARVARNGAIIEIDAGEYRDCAVWRANRLTIRGVGKGYAHVRDVSCQGKGIWVIKGNFTRVQRIEFSGADVPHNNGAGIRLEGNDLILSGSYFHDNENGILAGRRPRSRVVIRSSIFERNGKCEPHCAHGIYIGHVARLSVAGSTFRDQRVGHHIKSRAKHTEIVGNRITDGLTGTASMSINLPNGGTAVIRSNYIQQGPRAENHAVMISIGEEGATNRSRGILIQSNVFENRHPRSTVFIRNRTRQPAVLSGNRFQGAGRKLEGPGTMR